MNIKIGWQKYEDYIEKQLSCPMLQNILKSILLSNKDDSDDYDEEDEDEDDDDSYEDDDQDKTTLLSSTVSQLLPITPQIVDDISMLSNFDCWIGHTNFDITPSIKDKLDRVPGIEILKVISRYRFFIGVGQMFDFQDVRQSIEDEILKGDI